MLTLPLFADLRKETVTVGRIYALSVPTDVFGRAFLLECALLRQVNASRLRVRVIYPALIIMQARSAALATQRAAGGKSSS